MLLPRRGHAAKPHNEANEGGEISGLLLTPRNTDQQRSDSPSERPLKMEEFLDGKYGYWLRWIPTLKRS